MTSTNPIALYRNVKALSEKTQNYARNLAWVDATRRDGAMAVYGGWKLAERQAQVEAASKAFAASVAGMTTEQVVAIIIEAEAA